MAPTLFDKKPEPGDLIEIFRGGYQHWAVYIGDGFVIHLAPPSEIAHAGANSMMSVLCDKAKVKKEELYKVVERNEYRINNLLDSKYEPKSPGAIVRDAERRVGQELPYSFIQRNCEHFATELRYGKPESRQVCQARDVMLAAGAAAAVGIGVFAIASYFMGGSKEKKDHQ
ncbi:phospholipase A and acyltransferase 3-like [Conger conger]|uniref:phospholipase A and acyltransferase 3-like n=1 Tax=Conger conger TaxID=82655 RepID=UPI002A5A7C95|nr:phospholipase A and acyltransferase 3-like [Conger conger]